MGAQTACHHAQLAHPVYVWAGLCLELSEVLPALCAVSIPVEHLLEHGPVTATALVFTQTSPNTQVQKN